MDSEDALLAQDIVATMRRKKVVCPVGIVSEETLGLV